MKQIERHDTTVASLREAIAKDPQIPRFHNALGLVLEDRGQFEEAVLVYQEAVPLDPRCTEIFHMKAGQWGWKQQAPL
jgi:Flp pilus assembly protein TadD